MKFSLYGSDEKNMLLIQNSDTSNVAKVLFNNELYEAVVSNYQFRGPKYRGEYWIYPGRIAISR